MIWVGIGWAVGLGTVGDSLFGTGWGSSGFRLTQSRAAVLRLHGGVVRIENNLGMNQQPGRLPSPWQGRIMFCAVQGAP